MIAAIIAGGKGRRLKEISGEIPKPMVLLSGKPVLQHQVELLVRWGVTDIHLLTGFLGYMIRDYFADGHVLGVQIHYHQENEPLGTSGCVRALSEIIEEDFLLLYGDIILDMKLDDFLAYHRQKGAAATLAVHPNDHPYDSDLVVMDDDDRITGFISKDRKPLYYNNCVSAAVYVLSPAVFRYIPKGLSSDFVRDVFPAMLDKNEKLYGYKTVEYIKDMGTPDRFETVSNDYATGKIRRWSKEQQRPAIFMDRDGTLVEEVDLLHQIDDLTLFPFSAGAVKKINYSDFLAITITNQPVVARNLCDMETVREIHRKMEALLGEEGAYLNAIYFCPHHPDRGYPGENPAYKMECDCRKPKTGLIQKARNEYPVDVSDSWIIGDRTTDIQTGVNAGIGSILVRTGKGGKDGRFLVKPDFVFDNLAEAVSFILDDRKRLQNDIDGILSNIEIFKSTTPSLILVGGQARSGKSTFANLLVKNLTKKGISSKILSLDNWLIGASDRNESMTIRERYRYIDIERDVTHLLDGKQITLNHYDPYRRETSPGDFYFLAGSSCLILEGVPALDIKKLREIACMRIYVDIKEELRYKRFLSFYRWKDLAEEEINHLYQKRLEDEVPIVESSKQYSTIIIRM